MIEFRHDIGIINFDPMLVYGQPKFPESKWSDLHIHNRYKKENGSIQVVTAGNFIARMGLTVYAASPDPEPWLKDAEHVADCGVIQVTESACFWSYTHLRSPDMAVPYGTYACRFYGYALSGVDSQTEQGNDRYAFVIWPATEWPERLVKAYPLDS